MRVALWGPTNCLQVAWLSASDSTAQWDPVCKIVFDSIHPFVRKDCNGADIYEGDRVRIERERGRFLFSIGEGTIQSCLAKERGYFLAATLWPEGRPEERREGGALELDEHGMRIALLEEQT